MTPLESALSSGFAVLLNTNGEQVAFRGDVIKAVINRSPTDRQLRQPDFDPVDASEVRLFRTAVSAMPRPGEIFQDNSLTSHRVKTVKTIGQFHSCQCQPTTATAEGIATESGDVWMIPGGDLILIG